MKRTCIYLAVLMLLVAGCINEPSQHTYLPHEVGHKEALVFEQRTIFISTRTQTHAVTIEVADTPLRIQTGLMYRDDLPTDQGMLFVYTQDRHSAFWMKNTKIPLTIAFIDEDQRIVQMIDMAPCLEDPCQLYHADQPFRYALEMNQGWFESNGVTVGDSVDIGQIETVS